MGMRSPIKRTEDRRRSRKRELTSKEILALANEIRATAAEIESLAAEIDSRALAKVGIDGAAKIDDSLVLLRQFIGKLKSGIDNEIALARTI